MPGLKHYAFFVTGSSFMVGTAANHVMAPDMDCDVIMASPSGSPENDDLTRENVFWSRSLVS